MKKNENRGGAREGAGRIPMDEKLKRMSASFSVSPETKGKITELKGRGIKIGKEFDKWVDGLDATACVGGRKKRNDVKAEVFTCMVAPSTRKLMSEFKGLINFSTQMEKMVESLY